MKSKKNSIGIVLVKYLFRDHFSESEYKLSKARMMFSLQLGRKNGSTKIWKVVGKNLQFSNLHDKRHSSIPTFNSFSELNF